MREQRAVRRGRGRRLFAWAFGLVTALAIGTSARYAAIWEAQP